MKTKKELEQEYIDSYKRGGDPTLFCVIIAFLCAGGLIAIIYGIAWVLLNILT